MATTLDLVQMHGLLVILLYMHSRHCSTCGSTVLAHPARRPDRQAGLDSAVELDRATGIIILYTMIDDCRLQTTCMHWSIEDDKINTAS